MLTDTSPSVANLIQHVLPRSRDPLILTASCILFTLGEEKARTRARARVCVFFFGGGWKGTLGQVHAEESLAVYCYHRDSRLTITTSLLLSLHFGCTLPKTLH